IPPPLISTLFPYTTLFRSDLFASRSPGFREWRTALASEFPQRPLLESRQAPPSSRRRALQSPAKSEICAHPTRFCASPTGNNDRSPREDKVSAENFQNEIVQMKGRVWL